MSDPGTTAILLLQLSTLAPLRGYQDVDALVERVLDAIRGVEGLGRYDLDRLRRWSERWSLVHREVRRFYTVGLADSLEQDAREALARGLRALLDGTAIDLYTSGHLARLHLDLLGASAGRDLTRLSR